LRDGSRRIGAPWRPGRVTITVLSMASHPPPAVEPEKRVGPLELFFDLVFVFALTQVTARL